MFHYLHPEHPLHTPRSKNIRIIFAVLFLIAIFEWHYADKFYPRTFIGEIAVGGMTFEEAQERLLPALAVLEEYGVDIIVENEHITRTITLPAAVTGFTSDTVVEYISFENPDEALLRVYRRGLWRQVASVVAGQHIRMPATLHPEAVQSFLERERFPNLEKD